MMTIHHSEFITQHFFHSTFNIHHSTFHIMLSVDQLEDKLIDLAFAEDIGDGDHTTLCCIPEDAMGRSHLLIKEDGILAGVEVAKKVFDSFEGRSAHW